VFSFGEQCEILRFAQNDMEGCSGRIPEWLCFSAVTIDDRYIQLGPGEDWVCFLAIF